MTVSSKEKNSEEKIKVLKAELMSYIEKGQGLNVVTLIVRNRDCRCVGQLIGLAIDEECSHIEYLVLHHFAKLLEEGEVDHDRWVTILANDLSYILWKRENRDKQEDREKFLWLRKLYREAFKGFTGHRIDDPDPYRLLVKDFISYARGTVDPEEFWINSDIMRSLGLWTAYSKDRVELAPFDNEVDFLHWKFCHPDIRYKGAVEGFSVVDLEKVNVINVEKLLDIITTLKKAPHGWDTAELEAELRRLVRERYHELMGHHSRSREPYEKKRIEEALKVTCDQMASLGLLSDDRKIEAGS